MMSIRLSHFGDDATKYPFRTPWHRRQSKRELFPVWFPSTFFLKKNGSGWARNIESVTQLLKYNDFAQVIYKKIWNFLIFFNFRKCAHQNFNNFDVTAYVSEKPKCRRKRYRKNFLTVRLVSA